jgi:hypothetical protein
MTNLEVLLKTKVEKLSEQKTLSDKMNSILASMNDSTKLKKRNLRAAIAVSNQPGFFDYYETPDDIKQMEDNKVLNKIARQVAKVGREIEAITEEISLIKKPKDSASENSFRSLDQWLESYGRPNIYNSELISSFKPSAKIYGGTAHHRSFKSSAATMRKGRVTR